MKKIVSVDNLKKEVFTVEIEDNKILSVKNHLGYLPGTHWPQVLMPKEEISSDINLSDLLERHLHILFRETKALMEQSSRGKLDRDAAHSMRENLKLILDLLKKEKEILQGFTGEDLKKAKELVNAKT